MCRAHFLGQFLKVHRLPQPTRVYLSVGANTMIFSKRLDQWLVAGRRYVLAVPVSLVACVTPLCAQQSQQLTPPRVEGKVMFGTAIFNEDLEHKVVGGAVRAYLTKDRKSTRLNSSHGYISYAVFCLKK